MADICRIEGEKVGFEVEIPGIAIENIEKKNGILLMQIVNKDATAALTEIPYIRIETEGSKSTQNPYIEVISAPFSTEEDIYAFFEFIQALCRRIESKKTASIKTCAEDAYNDIKSRYENIFKNKKILFNDIIDKSKYSQQVPQMQGSVHANIAIPYEKLSESKIIRSLIFNESGNVEKYAQTPFAKAQDAACSNELKNSSPYAKSLLTQLFYQLIVYANHKIKPEFVICKPGSKPAATGGKTGGDDSLAKTEFNALIKAGQADVLRVVFKDSEDNKDNMGKLENLKNFLKMDSVKKQIVKTIKNICDSNTLHSLKVKPETIYNNLLKNIEGCLKKESEFIYDEPRIGALIQPYKEGKNYFIVLEARKQGINPIVNAARDASNSKATRKNIKSLINIIEDLYNDL